MSGSTKAKLLDIIIDEIKNVPALLVDGTRSGGWLYPFKVQRHVFIATSVDNTYRESFICTGTNRYGA